VTPATKTRPEHHAGRPSRKSVADALYTYNCLGEHLIEYNGKLIRHRARRDYEHRNHPKR
jgi:hypothetical protein